VIFCGDIISDRAVLNNAFVSRLDTGIQTVLGSLTIGGSLSIGSSITTTGISVGTFTFTASPAVGALMVSDASGVGSWKTLNNLTSGTLPVARGGTGIATLTAGYLPFGNGTGALLSDSNLFWDNTNKRLGIGTVSPSSLLHVATTTSGVINLVRLQHVNDTASGAGISFMSGAGAETGRVEEAYDGSGQTSLRFYTYNSGLAERMRITATGNVGIGNTPVQKLDVNGSIRIGNYIYSASSFIGVAADGGNALPFKTGGLVTSDSYSDAAPTNGIYCKGSLGVGVVSPTSKFHVEETVNGESGILARNLNASSSAYSIMRLRNDSGGSGVYLFLNSSTRNSDGAANSATLRNANGDLSLQSSGSSGIIITATNGNVGIGASPSSYKLYVNGTSYFNDNISVLGTSSAYVGTARFSSSSGTFDINYNTGGNLYYYGGTTAIKFSVDTSGNTLVNGKLGVGAAAVTYPLEVTGDIKATGVLRAGASFVAGTTVQAGFYMNSSDGAYRSIVTDTADSEFYFQSNAGVNSYVCIGLNGTYAGRVGIGTSAPGQTLDVRGNIYTNGKIGIGITPSTYLLDVAGNVRLGSGASDVQLVNGKIRSASSALQIIGNVSAGIWFTDTADTCKMSFVGGKLGIGSSLTAPESELHIKPVAGGGITIDNIDGNSKSKIMFREINDSAYGATLQYDPSGDLFSIFTLENSVEKGGVHLKRANGFVGICNTNPTTALDVTGNITVSGTVDGVDVGAHTHSGAGQGGTVSYANLSNRPAIIDVYYTVPFEGYVQGAGTPPTIIIPGNYTYVIGSNQLLVFVDGDKLRKDTDISSFDRDYWEVAGDGGVGVGIRLNFDLSEGSWVEFMIIPL
jgi:hypothetical protein